MPSSGELVQAHGRLTLRHSPFTVRARKRFPPRVRGSGGCGTGHGGHRGWGVPGGPGTAGPPGTLSSWRALTKPRRQGRPTPHVVRASVGLVAGAPLPSRFRAAWRPRKRARAVKSRTRRFAPASDDLSGSPEKKPWSLDPRRFGLGQRLASVPGGSRRRNAHEPSARTQCNFQPGPSKDS